MGKYISKLMLVLALLFFGGVVFIICTTLAGAFFQEAEQFALMDCLALSGLFLGLYRIIVLLEDRR